MNSKSLKKLKFNKQKMNLNEFLVRAKKNIYAGNGREIILLDGAKEFFYNFEYFCDFSGDINQFEGREFITYPRHLKIYHLNFHGGSLKQK